MTRKIIITLLWGVLAVSVASAQTTVPGGDVSGIWEASGQPYLIEGDITIPAGDTLTIAPACSIIFQGGYSLTVNGTLEAIGTEADSIQFTGPGWGWITFQSAPDSSHLVYCSISNAGTGVSCYSSNPVISHSTIIPSWFEAISLEGSSSPEISHCNLMYSSQNAIRVLGSSSPEISHCNLMYNQWAVRWSSTGSGTISDCIISYSDLCGIWLYSAAELTLVDCFISDNTSNDDGAGVRSSNHGTLNFINCTISDNDAGQYHGGGVYCGNYSTATFTDCTINGNSGSNQTAPYTLGGGGIALDNASATLSYCTIFDNFSPECGAGIAITNGNLAIDHCTIDGNYGVGFPSGISIDGSTANITNSIISNNYNGYGIQNSGTLTVEYIDFYNNPGGNIGGNVPTGFGDLDTVNTNGDSCDAYFNIFLDPLYVDQVNFDFHLTEDSPCIDAGDPASPLDPDNTITDIGRYYFDQGTPVIGRGQNEEIPIKYQLFSPYPNPFNPVTTFKVELPAASWVTLQVYDIAGRSTGSPLQKGWMPVGYHAVTFDGSGLASGVYVYRLETSGSGANPTMVTGKMVLMK